MGKIETIDPNKYDYEVAKTINDTEENNDGDVLQRIIMHLGGMGTYQRWLVLYMLPFGSVLGLMFSVQMFIAATPMQHWCFVPELRNLSMDLRRNLSIPGAAEGPNWERCAVYDANWTEVLETLRPPPNDTATIPCQYGWEYLLNDIPYPTVTSEQDWVCNRAGNAPFGQLMFFVGSLFGCLFFGWMGDAYGRIPAFVSCNVISFLGEVGTLYTTSVLDFAIYRFITGLAYDTNFIMIYILIMEYVGPSHRTWVTNMSYGLFVAGSQMSIPPLALWLLDWRKLLFITSLPMLLALVALFAVPESARWLASKGKLDRAVKVLRKFEKINKVKIPDDLMYEFTVNVNKGGSSITDVLKELLRCIPLRNCVLVLLIVTVIGQLSIDIVIRLTENVGYNFFIAFAASAFAEMPAMLFVTLTIDRYGRRPVIMVTLLLSAIFAFICAFLPGGVYQMIMAVTARLFVNMALITLIQIAPEILPTPVRATVTSIIHFSMFTCIMVSPYIVFSGRYWRPLPAFTMGLICCVGAALSFRLPETVGQPMPQTIADGEKLAVSTLMCIRPPSDEDMEELPPLKSKEYKQ